MRLTTALLAVTRGAVRNDLHHLPPGIFFSPFTEKKGKFHHHRLDTDFNEFPKTLKNVFKTCSENTNYVPSYKKRILQMLEYTPISSYYSFPVELAYKYLTPKEQLTEENLTRMKILRGAFQVLLVPFLQMDDIVDRSDIRSGKSCWHRVCPGGVHAAMYDGLVASHLPLHVVKKFLSDHPCYSNILYTMSEAARDMSVGQTLDILEQVDKTQTPEAFHQVSFKYAAVIRAQGRLGLLLAGLTDETLINKVDEIFLALGKGFQICDDFKDYYCSSEEAIQVRTDCKISATTWVSTTALQRFNRHQKEIFWNCLGFSDPSKEEAVLKLYDEINMPQLHVNTIITIYDEIDGMIRKLPHKDVSEYCRSVLDWCIGRPPKKLIL